MEYLNKTKRNILISYGFLTGLLILIINDWYLKEHVSNFLTGKLSDFAGLFIFPLVVLVFFPKNKVKIYLLTSILFLFWKSSLSQVFIDVWNNFCAYRINRVIDYTDLIALLVLPISFFYEKSKYSIIKIHPVFPLLISSFAFLATSYQKDYDYNKIYSFQLAQNNLIEKINQIQYDSSNINLPVSRHIENSTDFIVERGLDTIWYYSSGEKLISDTLYKFDKKKNAYTSEIDTVIQYKMIKRDSMYINQSGIFFYKIPVRKYMMESTTGYCDWVFAKVKIIDLGPSCSVELLQIKTSNCMGMFEKTAKKNEERNLQTAFEKEFIEKIKFEK